MYVIDGLRLTEYRYVHIDSPCELFKKYGFMPGSSVGGSASFDSEAVNQVVNKLDSLSLGASAAVTEYLNHLDTLKSSEVAPEQSDGATKDTSEVSNV